MTCNQQSLVRFQSAAYKRKEINNMIKHESQIEKQVKRTKFLIGNFPYRIKGYIRELKHKIKRNWWIICNWKLYKKFYPSPKPELAWVNKKSFDRYIGKRVKDEEFWDGYAKTFNDVLKKYI